MALIDLFTTFTAAKYCNVSYVSIKRWILAGKIKAYRTPGGHFRILKRDLQEFMIKNSIPIPDNDAIIRRSILIVDDDDDVRVSIAEYLKTQGYEITTANDGFEAGLLLNNYIPDLIILDLIMPNVNGFRVCELIKNNPKTRNIKLIVLTGYASEENIKKAYEQGVEKVLSKPVDMEDLLSTINSLS